ncbi:oxidoreductase [Fischerella thermalis CCMEE 5198]|jgi:NAD(P)-dependent dehydrogenase (short-subunit alcohol dehydrogenase family)|uniref:SDR family NAD(P)-dependent oxidoreductase n=1 Tax=Fischerella thermalis TaxID=372787 RepID=UPI000C80E56A|nr:SDR family NAD(P)-dependent oxidoreductase [Fischerella thermalis]PMB00735.1 oxidoreductase [Fischerella thermalis CCMEE 5196]PMB24939.1 oxidoreductase [Fischerella thermalis CCMEE 5198]PMB53288.1 oxidoreductase [Fischerella thermalis CCMEE 5201]
MQQNLFDLSGKVAIITGSGRGLGKVMAVGLADLGVKVIVGDRNFEEAKQTAQTIKDAGGIASATFVDISESDSCNDLIQFAVNEFGQVNILVNNAGIDIIKPAEAILESEWDEILNVNLKGHFHCSQFAAIQMMKQNTGGAIINISSIASVVGIPGLVAYSAAKGGINQLTRVMAVEWASKNIRVNAIAPGYFENIMLGVNVEHEKLEKQKQIVTFTPMARRGKPEELIGPLVFLASDASSYITGAILFVDGGYTAA